MNKILVTGANGFLGSACLKQLMGKGDELHALDLRIPEDSASSSVNWHDTDLEDKAAVAALMQEVKPDALLHLAWSIEKAGEKYTSNIHRPCVQIGLDLVEAFKEAGGSRVVVAGTCAEYDWQQDHVHTEESPLKPQNIYAQSKRDLCIGLETFCDTQELSMAWARIFLLYGPNENPNRLMPYVIRSILKNEPVKTTHGNQYRDYLYVDDVAAGLIALLECDEQGVFNVCSGKPVQLKSIVNFIAEEMNATHLVELGAIPASDGDVARLAGDNSRLKKMTSWSPKIKLEDGLRRTIKSIVEG